MYFMAYFISNKDINVCCKYLIKVIKCTSNIGQLNDTYNKYKNEVLESLAQKKEKIKSKYGKISNKVLKENLEERKNELLQRKNDIFVWRLKSCKN